MERIQLLQIGIDNSDNQAEENGEIKVINGVLNLVS